MATIQAPKPEIQLAKVGRQREKEKKRGAAALWWGSPAGMALKGGLAKIVVAMLVGCIGVGAHLAGKAARPKPGDVMTARRAKSLFEKKDAKQDYGNVTGLPGDQAARQDSLSMVAGGADPNAAAAAAAAAAAGANGAGGAAGADAAAKDAAAKDAATPAAPAVDPAAMMAKAMGEGEKGKDGKEGKNGSFDKKFGELSKGFGGSGSSGSMLSGGGGMFGGTGGAFKPLGGGTMRAMSNNNAQVARTSGARAKGGGRSAFAQLATQHNNDRRALNASTGEAMSAGNSAVFDGVKTAGTDVLGAGAGIGGAGVGKQGGGAGATGSGASGEGGPTSSPGSGAEGGPQDKKSDCDIMSKDVGLTLVANSTGGCVPDPGKGSDVTPWDKWSKAAQVALAAGAVLLMIGQLLLTIEKAWPQYTSTLKYFVYICAGLAMACAATALIAGISIFSQGGQIEGVMDMLGGGIMGVMAYMLIQSQEQQSDAAQKKLDENTQKGQTTAHNQLDHQRDLVSNTGGMDRNAPGAVTDSVGQTSATDNGNGLAAVNDDAHGNLGIDNGAKPINTTPANSAGLTNATQGASSYTQVPNANGGTTTTFYNADNQPISVATTDASNNLTGYNTVSAPDANGVTTTQQFGANGQSTGTITSSTSNGVTTYNQYGPQQQVTQVVNNPSTDPGAPKTITQTSTVNGPLQGTTTQTPTASGGSVWNTYDGSGNFTGSDAINGNGQVMSTTSVQNGVATQTQFGYSNGAVDPTQTNVSSFQTGSQSTMQQITSNNQGVTGLHQMWDSSTGDVYYQGTQGNSVVTFNSSGQTVTAPSTLTGQSSTTSIKLGGTDYPNPNYKPPTGH